MKNKLLNLILLFRIRLKNDNILYFDYYLFTSLLQIKITNGFQDKKYSNSLLDQLINESKTVNIELYNLQAKCNLNLYFVDQCISDVNIILNYSNSTVNEQNEAYTTLSQLYAKIGDLQKEEEYANLSNSN